VAKLTPEANRAARGILQWSLRELADNAGVAFSTVHRFEKTGSCTDTVEEKIKTALALKGVEITNGNGTGARLLASGRVENNGEGGVANE
jgi:transcriptional regulator with XRE-family HTH domain